MKARALMVLGTGSHVGKSLLVAALCRILKQEGFSVAPFKAQNMALNSAATPDGLEIGRAQAMQAEAAGIPATTDMNPVLIKPSSDTNAQIIVRGRVWNQLMARDYHRKKTVKELFPLITECYQNLASKHDFIVLEGAGSPAEINLKSHDIVNLRMAKAANAECILVGDIDRGGVFASLYGTLALLEDDEQSLIKGFLINKFRGDINLLAPGVKMIEARLQKQCIGVVPFLPNVGLEEEDSVSLETRRTEFIDSDKNDLSSDRKLRIAIIAIPFISNFTDFDALIAEKDSVSCTFVKNPQGLDEADIIIIPGSKETIGDLRWLRKQGFDEVISRHVQERKLIIGVCGGMQMLGLEINDSGGLESGGHEVGLGFLGVETRLTGEKVTVPATGAVFANNIFDKKLVSCPVEGYEIHLGETVYRNGTRAFASIFRQTNDAEEILDGAVSADGKVFGTYLHGIFDTDEFRHTFIRAARKFVGLSAPENLVFFQLEKESRYDRLAGHVRKNIDLEEILGWF